MLNYALDPKYFQREKYFMILKIVYDGMSGKRLEKCFNQNAILFIDYHGI